MMSHTYRVGTEQGGPAGPRFTGTMSKAAMNRWRKAMLRSSREAGMVTHLLVTYVDCCTNVVNTLKQGAVCERKENEIIISSEQRKKDLDRVNRIVL